MKCSDWDPVSAWFSGIESTLLRGFLVWLIITVGLVIPMIPRGGIEAAFFPALISPLAVIYGVYSWSSLGVPWCLLVVPILGGLLLSAWSFLVGSGGRFAVWGLVAFSMLLTGPSLVGTAALWGELAASLLLSVAYFGLPWWWERRCANQGS